VDESKINAIRECPTPTFIQQVRSSHDRASSCGRLMKNFSSIVAPMIEVHKCKRFEWNEKAPDAFVDIKSKFTNAPILPLLSFSKVFEVDCDASRVGIRAVLSQERRPLAYLSKKLNDTKRKYSTYDKEFYAVVRALEHWRHYLVGGKFILHSNHEALKFI